MVAPFAGERTAAAGSPVSGDGNVVADATLETGEALPLRSIAWTM